MHALRNFSFTVLLLVLALTAAEKAHAAPQAAPVVHSAIGHHAPFRSYVRRRYLRRDVTAHSAVRPYAVRPAAVQHVIVQPAFIGAATASVKSASAPKPVKAASAPKPAASQFAKAAVATMPVKPATAIVPIKPAAATVPKPVAQAASKPAAVTASAPDYGGRDSAPLTTVGDAAPNPAAQAGRALEALVLVLAGVVGVVYVLKRFNLVRPGANGKPARIAGPGFGRSPSSINADVAVVSSQSLPGGAMLHVVRVDGKNLLLASTAQSVTSVAEWTVPEAHPTGAANSLGASEEFEEFLTRADPSSAGSGIAAANARLRSLLASAKPEEPS